MLGLQSYELPRSESIEYLEYLIEYLEAVEEDKYNFLVDEKKEELEGLIYFFVLELKGWVDQVKAYSFHLRLIATIDQSWHVDWTRPAADTVHVLWDHMALITLPRGPVETVQSWYALARLAVAVLGLISWSDTEPPHAHIYAGVCKEKGASDTQAVCQHFLTHHADISDFSFYEQ